MLKQKEAQRTRDFLKHMIIASKKIGERNQAKLELEGQIEKIRQLSHANEDRQTINTEINTLKDLIKKVLEVEGKLLHHHGDAGKYSSEMEDKMKRLEQKIDNYIEVRDRREKRIRTIERKIKGEVGENREEIEKVESNIKRIQLKMKELQKMGKIPKDKHIQLKNRIEDYKQKLDKIKGL
ncbi:MAG: hypothetical protein V1740_00595 [Candidatus Woesearchaeota archaeon]